MNQLVRYNSCVLDASIAAPGGHSVKIAVTLVYAKNRTPSTAVTRAVVVNVDTAGEVRFALTHAHKVSTGPTAYSPAHARMAEHVIPIREIAGNTIAISSYFLCILA